jgi:hypothetical protein
MSEALAEASAVRFDGVLPVADAVMYEGYVLYPYRASSLKNRVRWNFGGIYPRVYSEAQTGEDRAQAGSECLVRGESGALTVEVRFLELSEPSRADAEEARPHVVRCEFGRISRLARESAERAFSRGRLHGSLEVSAFALGNGVFRLRLTLRNESNSPSTERTAALPDTLIAAHLLLGVSDAEFISQLDPPRELASEAQACQQRGLWPVLAGAPGSKSAMLASPIILYDYPQIAPESRADSCDATEIDEILLLRVLTLSDAEKRELASGDPRARAILARAEALSAKELFSLHGRLQQNTPPSRAFAVGERVRLKPKAQADIFDLALAGKIATVRAIERDFEDRVYLSVTVDDDPGADLGAQGMPGHRFFFFLDEVERLDSGAAS